MLVIMPAAFVRLQLVALAVSQSSAITNWVELAPARFTILSPSLIRLEHSLPTLAALLSAHVCKILILWFFSVAVLFAGAVNTMHEWVSGGGQRGEAKGCGFSCWLIVYTLSVGGCHVFCERPRCCRAQ